MRVFGMLPQESLILQRYSSSPPSVWRVVTAHYCTATPHTVFHTDKPHCLTTESPILAGPALCCAGPTI